MPRYGRSPWTVFCWLDNFTTSILILVCISVNKNWERSNAHSIKGQKVKNHHGKKRKHESHLQNTPTQIATFSNWQLMTGHTRMQLNNISSWLEIPIFCLSSTWSQKISIMYYLFPFLCTVGGCLKVLISWFYWKL